VDSTMLNGNDRCLDLWLVSLSLREVEFIYLKVGRRKEVA
jgi:hypothetical protein